MSSKVSSSAAGVAAGAASRKVWSMVSNTKRLVGAALVRKRTLCLGGVASGFPSSLPNLSSAFASATPYPTNMFIVAHGEREGLWHGARLEMYGSLVRLIRSKYYAIPTSETTENNELCDINRYKMELLNAITVQLNRIYQLFDKVDSGEMSCANLNSVLAEHDKSNSDIDEYKNNNNIENKNSDVNDNAEEEEEEALKWHFIWTDTNQNDSPKDDNSTNNNDKESVNKDKKSIKQVNKNRNDGSSKINENTAAVNWDEEVVAQWFRSSHVEFDLASTNTPVENNNKNDDVITPIINFKNSNRIVDKAFDENDLLTENGICFARPNEAGLRVMRAARLAFLARVETCIASCKNGTSSSSSSSSSFSSSDSTMSAGKTTTKSSQVSPSYNPRENISYSSPTAYSNDTSEGGNANMTSSSFSRSNMTSFNQMDTTNNNKRRRTINHGNNNRNNSGTEEEFTRPLSILDVSEVDSSCSQTAMQCVAEAGLISEQQCQLTFVPLSLQATLYLSNEMRTSLRIIMPRSNKLHENPFDCLPLYSCDVAAYTSYIELTLPRLTYTNNNNKSKYKTDSFLDNTSIRIRREDASSRIAMALMTLRRGAAVLITFIPTAQSVMEYCRVMESRTQYLEVSREAQLIKDAKRIVAMAISKSGRWSYITDEILPAVDAPQGSAFSLMVIMLEEKKEQSLK